MKFSPSLQTRLILSHLTVAMLSIIIISIVAGNYIYTAAEVDLEHDLEALAFATTIALEEPVRRLSEGQGEVSSVQSTVAPLLTNQPFVFYGIYWPDGTLLLRSSNLVLDQASESATPEIWQALQRKNLENFIIRPDTEGTRTLFFATRIEGQGKIYAVLSMGTPLRIATQQARQNLVLLVFSSLLVGLGVSLFGYLLANTLARPIKRLTQTAELLAQGEMDTRAEPGGPPELHRLAEAFNSMATRLQHHLNELRAFVANASHELRTPLTVVKLRTEALKAGAVNEPELADQFLSDIEFEVDRLSYMVNDMLDLSRMEANLSPQPRSMLNLGSIATEVYEAFGIRSARAGVNMDIKIDPEIPLIPGNEDQIRRVLYNLMENAIKYTPRDGNVSLIIQTSRERDTVTMLVSDTGPGIPADHIAHIFERFYRVEATRPRYSASKGSGLGLAIAKTIVESHKGKIGVVSRPGEGATFWVAFPVKS